MLASPERGRSMPEVTILAVRVDFGWREYIEYVVLGPRGGAIPLSSASIAGAVARYFTDQEFKKCGREDRERLIRQGARAVNIAITPVLRPGDQIGTKAVFTDAGGTRRFIGIDFSGDALTEVGEEEESRGEFGGAGSKGSGNRCTRGWKPGNPT